MDAKNILEQLLASGKELAEKSRDVVGRSLDLPADGSERTATMDGMKKGAAIGGVLALLLGTGVGRRVTGSAIKYGSLAASVRLPTKRTRIGRVSRATTPMRANRLAIWQTKRCKPVARKSFVQ